MNNLLAAFIFFTRLPFWRLRKVPAEAFQHVVPWWPWVGWLTGGVMAATLWLCAQVLPLPAAWMVAIVVRLLITGCLHEDGLADFCDGLGGGTTRQRALEIMKDSHIGTYGVVTLILYFLLLWTLPQGLPLGVWCVLVVCADVWGKCCASQIINVLPYARSQEQSKARVVYSRMTACEWVTGFIGALLPLVLLLPAAMWWACLAPVAVFGALCLLMRRRLGGYTGDCCGATFLLCELSFYLCFMCLWRL